jgi:hypothetical protein
MEDKKLLNYCIFVTVLDAVAIIQGYTQSYSSLLRSNPEDEPQFMIRVSKEHI